jgi:ribonuclease P protein component
MAEREPSEIRRIGLLITGWAMVVVAPLTAPLPGPGATLLFAGGLALILQNSAWARRKFAVYKRRYPKVGDWIDWGLRRDSARRRRERDRDPEAPRLGWWQRLTSTLGFSSAPGNEVASTAALLRSETRELHDEADLSAVEPGAGPSPRLPQPHGDAGRPQRDSRPPRARPQEAVGVSTLRLRRDFLAANKGKRAPMPGFVLLMHRREDGDPTMRVGFTVTKKIGNAVVRNRMKRRLRALSRELLPTSGVPGADHVLIGREGGIERDFSLMRAELAKALAKVQRA